MSELTNIFRKFGVPPAMIVRPDDPSAWMLPLSVDLAQLCKLNRKPIPAQFAFVEGREMQAVAIQDDQEAVGVYAGMFWLLCRLAAGAAGSDVFPVMRGPSVPRRRPEPLASHRTPRSLLREGEPFDWMTESQRWREYPDRQLLFLYVAEHASQICGLP